MRASSVRPDPMRPKTPEHFAGVKGEADVLDDVDAADAFGVERASDRRRRLPRREELIDRAPDHRRDHAGNGEIAPGAAGDQRAVAEDGDVVGKREHVAEDVRDVDHRLAGLREACRSGRRGARSRGRSATWSARRR